MQSWEAFAVFSAKLSQLETMFFKTSKKHIVDCFSKDIVRCMRGDFISVGVLPMGRYGQL
jgi:hypothetical protein